MTLTHPDFTLDKPNPSSLQPDPIWWLWLRLDELFPQGLLGGIYANKPGFHNTGAKNKISWPNNYSIRDTVNQFGIGWTKASALDWTFPDAQAGRYANIDKFTSRLVSSSMNSADPRLDVAGLFEFFGQADNDSSVEGYNEYREDAVSSDASHLWHIHKSFIRSRITFWGMWALLTVYMGWTVQQWRDSLPPTDPNSSQKPPPPVKPSIPAGLPVWVNGARQLWGPGSTDWPGGGKLLLRGTDVLFVQRFIGARYAGEDDGIMGSKSVNGVKWYQKLRGLQPDGIVGPKTWAQMGVKATF